MKNSKKFTDECIKLYGKNSQIMIAIEEMSELQKELCKYIRRTENPGEYTDAQIAETIQHIQEETADVYVTVGKIAYIFGEAEIEKIQEQKIARCKKKMSEWKARQSK